MNVARSSSTPPSPSAGRGGARGEKWWHVPDQKIEELVRGLDSPGTSPAHALPRSVRFEGDQGDALDQLMRRSFTRSSGEPWRPAEGQEGATGAPEEEEEEEEEYVEDAFGQLVRRKKWHVTEQQLLHKIAQMADVAESGKYNGTQRKLPSPSARRVQSERCLKGDGKIEVNIFFIESGDTLCLRVNPDIRLGPAKPPPTNAFTELFGQGATTKGFQGLPKSFDCRRREFGSTMRPGWTPAWTDSLKEHIFQVTNIAVERQRLTCRYAPMTIEEMTLRTYGLKGGETLHIRVLRLPDESRSVGRNPVLACTKRKQEERAKQQRRHESSRRPGCGAPCLRSHPQLARCKVGGDVWMMPRWITQEHPKLFARVGIGLDELGHPTVPNDFGSSPIYLDDANDRAMRRVRDRIC